MGQAHSLRSAVENPSIEPVKTDWFIDINNTQRIYVTPELSQRLSSVKKFDSIEYKIGKVQYSAKKLSQTWIVQTNHSTMEKVSFYTDSFDTGIRVSLTIWKECNGKKNNNCQKQLSKKFSSFKYGEQVKIQNLNLYTT